MKFLIFVTFIALAQAKVFRPKNFEELSKRFVPRIVGGNDAIENQFPYQAALFFDNGAFCGGSIIARKTILTAASCADGATSVKVVVGQLRVHDTTPTPPTFIGSSDFLTPTDWDPWYKSNNIALVFLPIQLTYIEEVKKIDLYEKTSKLETVDATISGWGRISGSSSAYSPILRYTSAKVLSNTDCMKYFSADVIKDTNLCLDGKTGKSTCNGDIGGPLTVQDEGVTVLAGVASFGSAWGCSIEYPSVYSRVSSYTVWITTYMKD